MAHDSNDVASMFRLIAHEIITKQNGLDMSEKDFSQISEGYREAGGDTQKLVSGVMAEFDTLKDTIIKHYEEGDPRGVSASVNSVRQRILAARVAARKISDS